MPSHRHQPRILNSRQHPRTLLFAAIALWIAGLALGFAAIAFSSFDVNVNTALGHVRSDPTTVFAVLVDVTLGPIGAICILLVLGGWLAIAHEPRKALAFVTACGAGWLSSSIAKQIVSRPRPPTENMLASVTETGLDSFPSGHTAFAVSLALTLGLVLARPGRSRRITITIGLTFAGIVGLTRIYLGVHYPTDVIGSFIIATGGVLILIATWTAVEHRFAPSTRDEPEKYRKLA